MINFNSNKQSFEAFIESIPEGIMICNIYGEIKFVNSALLQITGYSQECIMNMNIQDMVYSWNNITSNIHNISIQQNVETSIKSVKNMLKLNLNIYPLYTKKWMTG
ncbi:PAS domain-containing protein [Clostridium ljungdahlii]|uniref:PAS domain-containing protein n=1 Tax=Clostridium ljungdahlii TaxID=1538 RepID=UPI00386C470B